MLTSSPKYQVWKYIYFVDYLMNKDATEHNGAESYVHAQLANDEMLWVPVQNSCAIQVLTAVSLLLILPAQPVYLLKYATKYVLPPTFLQKNYQR